MRLQAADRAAKRAALEKKTPREFFGSGESPSGIIPESNSKTRIQILTYNRS
jgi:hypothetical protein